MAFFLTTHRRLWGALTQAIIAKDMEAATTAKTAVEDAQRESRRKLEESSSKHVPRFFEVKDGRWVPKLTYASHFPSSTLCMAEHTDLSVPRDPEAATKAVNEWIWSTLPTPPPAAATSSSPSTAPSTPP